MTARFSLVIPTYRRGEVVVATAKHLLALPMEGGELIIVDQTLDHPKSVSAQLAALAAAGSIRWLRLREPSIPAAMNAGLLSASGDWVLYLDDDILPDPELVTAHKRAQAVPGLVAGCVLQPGQVMSPLAAGEAFRFNSDLPANISEFMGGNFSVTRLLALELGGFDENFVGAAYRFEAEFAARYVASHGPIRYEPQAIIHHLAIPTGGTRAHGHHLKTLGPSHSVGAYYYLLRTRGPGWVGRALLRPLRAIRTRHHLRRPWWIPVTLVAEIRGFLLALRLAWRGPKLLTPEQPAKEMSTT